MGSRSKVFFLLALAVISFAPFRIAAAQTSSFPGEYGEIIYRLNEESLDQLYIIGMSHRDTRSRANGDTTARAQAEAYKIGEWLVRNKMIELVLPEGFFRKPKTADQEIVVMVGRDNARPGEQLDIKEVEKRLSDDSTFMNAELLLKEHCSVKMRQVEDRGLYDAVIDGISRFESCGDDPHERYALKEEVEYLQQRRTADMLQRVPEIIDNELRKGGIRSRRALLTIGLNHIYEIIKYLQNRRITVYSPLFGMVEHEDYSAEMNLLMENFGITVIIPRALADNQDILVRTRLDKIIEQSRRQSPLASTSLPSL